MEAQRNGLHKLLCDLRGSRVNIMSWPDRNPLMSLGGVGMMQDVFTAPQTPKHFRWMRITTEAFQGDLWHHPCFGFIHCDLKQYATMQYQLVNIYECFPDIVSFGLFGYLFLQSYIILLINSMFRLNFHGSLKTTHFPFMALAAILGLVPWEPSNGNPRRSALWLTWLVPPWWQLQLRLLYHGHL